MAPTLYREDERTLPQHVEALHLAGRLREATGEKGARRVLLDLIVEGFGNKADNHYYSGDLLTRVAERFAGAKMYSDHLTREAEQKLGGLPRSWRDMVGRITRAWVDVTEGGRRVIRGEAEIFDDQLWKILEQAIDAVGVSINARGISRPGTADGRSARLVEDISQVKSVDVVSEAGAGGRILALIEAELEDTEDMATDVAEATTDKRRRRSDDADADRAEDAVDASVDDSLEDDDAEQRRRSRQREADAEASDDEDDDDIDDFDDDEDDDASDASDADASGDDASDDASADADADADAGDADGGDEGGGEETTAQEARRGGDPLLRFAADMGAEPAWGEEWRSEFDDPGLSGEDVHPRGRRVASPNGDFELVHEGGADAQQLTRMIESRARALAASRLRAAVQEALRVAREEYDERLEKRLAEAERGFQRKLAQRDQRVIAAGLIESASLPRLTTQRLKEEFFDAFYESDEGEPDEDALREAVTTAITDRKRELGEFTGRRGARTEGVGLTEGSVDAGDRRGGGERRESASADIDEGIERELG